MEESEYKSTYNELASVRCVFEKALTNNKAKCSLSSHFCLADREGYACKNAESSRKCSELLDKLRENSIFVLKLQEINGPLPHNMEIRVQVGGITGLAQLVDDKTTHSSQPGTEDILVTKDIHGIINSIVIKFGGLNNLPYSEIIKSIVQYRGRQRRQR